MATMPLLLLSGLLIGSTDPCEDEYQGCFRWASEQYCKKLPLFMKPACAKSCGLCDSPAADPCAPVDDAAGPGSIASVFSRAASLEQYKPTVLSEDPFIVVFDTFARPEEAAELAHVAERVGFGEPGSSCGYKPACNSASASCVPIKGSACWESASTQQFEARMLDLLGVPAANCEPLRFFRYRRGETFKRHHDAVGQELDPHVPGGPRVWSLYTFLAVPEEEGGGGGGGGGEFNFPNLNISIAPKAGRAVLWPHLRDDDLKVSAG